MPCKSESIGPTAVLCSAACSARTLLAMTATVTMHTASNSTNSIQHPQLPMSAGPDSTPFPLLQAHEELSQVAFFQDADLSYFGVGAKVAAACLARRVHVYTRDMSRSCGDEVQHALLDLDKLDEQCRRAKDELAWQLDIQVCVFGGGACM